MVELLIILHDLKWKINTVFLLKIRHENNNIALASPNS